MWYRSIRIASCQVLLALMLVSGANSLGASPSETLEKAIYTEETVGNVDEAIKLYEQVISEGKTARSSSAQALYRLSQCLIKKNKPAESRAALEKLISDYPEEKQLVAKARQQLPSGVTLLPVPWRDHEVMQINLKLATGLDAGCYFYRIDSVQHDGQTAWRCTTRSLITLNGMDSYSTVLVAKEGFVPISSRWKHVLLGDAEAVYQAQAVELKDLKKKTSREVAIDSPVYDNEQCAELFRRLPLAVGYKTTVPVFSTLGGAKVALELEVTATEMIEVPAGKFDCFKLVLNVGQSFYISADEHRYIVKFEAGPVAAELNRVFEIDPAKPAVFEGEAVSMTLPENWFAYSTKLAKKEDGERIYLLDVEGNANCDLLLKDFAEDTKNQSLKERMDANVADAKSKLKNFKLRDDRAMEQTIGGRPAYHFLADYTEGGKEKILFRSVILRETGMATINASMAADQFPVYQPSLEKIANSIVLK